GEVRMRGRGNGGLGGGNSREGRRWERREQRLDESFPDGVGDQARRVVNVELVHEVSSVRLGGLDADAEEPGDFFRGPTFGHELQDLPLARGEMIGWRRAPAQVRIDGGLTHARTEADGT